MNEVINNILKVVIVIAFFAMVIYSDVKYESECIYKTETVIGIVTDKEEDRLLSCAKPIICRTVYNTEVTLSDGVKTFFSEEEIYDVHEIGDRILIEVERKYHNGELVGIDYKTVESKRGD